MSTIFIYGRPGTGKTTLVTTLTKLGYIVNIIDVDQKADKMVNIAPLVQSGKVVIRPIESKLVDISLKQRILTPQLALAKQPKGYLEYCEIISEYEKEADEVLAGTRPARLKEVLVTDSLTSLIEHLKRLISQIQKKDKFTFDEWAILLNNLEEYFSIMMKLQRLFKHVIVIAHEMTERDEESGRVLSILPAIEGSMRNKVSKYFEEVYRTKLTEKAGKIAYEVVTKSIEKAEGRTSREIDTIVKSDFADIFKGEVASD